MMAVNIIKFRNYFGRDYDKAPLRFKDCFDKISDFEELDREYFLKLLRGIEYCIWKAHLQNRKESLLVS